MAYKNRVFDVQLKAHLKAMGAVLIEGPKWCGKTTTAKQLANSVISLQDTDHREEYLSTAITKPSFLLEGNVPRLIDEWQDAPMLWGCSAYKGGRARIAWTIYIDWVKCNRRQ